MSRFIEKYLRLVDPDIRVAIRTAMESAVSRGARQAMDEISNRLARRP